MLKTLGSSSRLNANLANLVTSPTVGGSYSRKLDKNKKKKHNKKKHTIKRKLRKSRRNSKKNKRKNIY